MHLDVIVRIRMCSRFVPMLAVAHCIALTHVVLPSSRVCTWLIRGCDLLSKHMYIWQDFLLERSPVQASIFDFIATTMAPKAFDIVPLPEDIAKSRQILEEVLRERGQLSTSTLPKTTNQDDQTSAAAAGEVEEGAVNETATSSTRKGSTVVADTHPTPPTTPHISAHAQSQLIDEKPIWSDIEVLRDAAQKGFQAKGTVGARFDRHLKKCPDDKQKYDLLTTRDAKAKFRQDWAKHTYEVKVASRTTSFTLTKEQSNDGLYCLPSVILRSEWGCRG